MYIKDMFTNIFVVLYLLFVFRMQFLIYSNNFYWLMLGWDGLGVVSFYLIYYYSNFIRLTNRIFTLFQNRLGDFFFIITLVCINYYLIVNLRSITYLCLGLLVWGACVKSAQFPFRFWLLSAMSAPTPISALVHSSTLVVAGVFVIIRFSYCLVEYIGILKLLRILTLFIRFLGLIYESDIKKLIAYSTINHVSIIMFLMSVGLYKVAFFHLNIHAIFKSILFIGFGIVILISFHNQSNSIISLSYSSPIFKVLYYFSCLSLSGLPFLIGFFFLKILLLRIC